MLESAICNQYKKKWIIFKFEYLIKLANEKKKDSKIKGCYLIILFIWLPEDPAFSTGGRPIFKFK